MRWAKVHDCSEVYQKHSDEEIFFYSHDKRPVFSRPLN